MKIDKLGKIDKPEIIGGVEKEFRPTKFQATPNQVPTPKPSKEKDKGKK